MSPMPVAIPNSDTHITKPCVASPKVLTEGGSSEAVLGNLTSSIPRNATEKHKKRKRLHKMATTAAADTEAERFAEESNGDLYITFPAYRGEGRVKVTRTDNRAYS